MQTVTLADLADRARCEGILQRVAAGERIVVEYPGENVALVSKDDLDWLEEADRQVDERLVEGAERVLGDREASQAVPLQEAASRLLR